MEYLSLSLLLCAVLTGACRLHALQPGYYRYFVYYLTISLLAETVAVSLVNTGHSNLFIYNFSLSGELLFFLWFLHKYFSNKNFKLVARIFSVFLFIIVLWEYYDKSATEFHSFTYSIGSFLLVSAIVLYFFQLKQSAQSFNPFHDFLFWAAMGILICYLLSYPFLSIFNYILWNNKPLSDKLTLLTSVANCFAFISYSIGFLCHRTQQNLQHQS